MFEGLISQVRVVKVGVPDVQFEPFNPQGEAPGFEPPPQLWVTVSVKDYGKILFEPLLPTLMWFSSGLPDMWSSLSQALSFLRKNCSICSCRLSVSMEENKFRIFLPQRLEPEPCHEY